MYFNYRVVPKIDMGYYVNYSLPLKACQMDVVTFRLQKEIRKFKNDHVSQKIHAACFWRKTVPKLLVN